MGESMGRDPEAAAAERVLSAELADIATAEVEGNEELVETFSNIGDAITKAVESGLVALSQGVNDVRDELTDVGVGLGEKLDDVVGFIVDPIRKGLNAVTKELTGSLDPALGAGIVVGAVYALRGVIKEKLTWIWNNWDEALQKGWDLLLKGLGKGWELLKDMWPHIKEGLIKLGKTVSFVANKVWKLIKETLIPAIVDGLIDLGTAIWDHVPDWLQTGLKAMRSVEVMVLSLAADLASTILMGLEKLFRAVGIDPLADVLGYLSDTLDALTDWLSGVPKRKSVEEREVEARGTTVAGIEARGSEQAKTMLAEATGAGLSETQAAGFAGMAIDDATAAEKAMVAFRSAMDAGNTAKRAYAIAFEAFRLARMGGGAAAVPLGPGADTGGVGDMVSEKAASVVAAQETNETLRRVVSLQEQALNEQRLSSGRSVPDVLDTISSADPLGVFGTGRMAGGLT